MNTKMLIEKYIQKKLTPSEKIAFDKLLETDPHFKKDVDFHSDLKKAITYTDEKKFRGFINDLENKNQQKVSQKTSKRNYTKWFAAASIALLFGTLYLFNLKQDFSNDQIFNSYFKPYKNVIAPLVRGEGNSQDTKTTAFLAYEKGNYEKAATLFNQLYSSTNEPYYLFYRANSLLKLGKIKEAIPLFKTHLKTKDTLAEKSNWYLALAYLKAKDTKEAKEILNKVIQKKLYKNKEARKILKTIK